MKLASIGAAIALLLSSVAANALTEPEQAFVDEMVAEHSFKAEQITPWLKQAEKREDILKAIARPWEAKPWFKYHPIFLTEKRVKAGVKFWQQHKNTLQRVEDELGIDAEVVVAIIGVETFYGSYQGKYPVLDSLYTLGFHYPKRAKFFRKELKEYFLLTREENLPIADLKGSYAGAMGWGQFISSSYRHYAIDFDKDGTRDLFNNQVDAIGSVANYFKRHRWQFNQPVAVPAEVTGTQYQSLLSKSNKLKHSANDILAKGVTITADVNTSQKARLLALELDVGEEHWLTFNNFYVITRYNHSPLYAMAVYQLSKQIQQAYQQAEQQ